MSQMIPLPEDSPTVDIRLAGRAYGLGSSTSYARAATGFIAPGVPVIKVGAKYRVPTSALRRALGLDEVEQPETGDELSPVREAFGSQLPNGKTSIQPVPVND